MEAASAVQFVQPGSQPVPVGAPRQQGRGWEQMPLLQRRASRKGLNYKGREGAELPSPPPPHKGQ